MIDKCKLPNDMAKLTLGNMREENSGMTLPAVFIRMTDLTKEGQRLATIETK